MRCSWPLSLTAASLLLGCGLSVEEEVLPQTPPGDTDQGKADQAPAARGLERPVLDSVPAQTCAKEIGIRGRAAPGVSVFAFGGAAVSGVSTDTDPGTGNFCLPVPLLAGKTNIIEVSAQDPELGVSEAATVTVVQKACSDGENEFPAGSTDTTKPVSKNVAFGAPAASKDKPKEGNGGFLTDEKASTWALYKQNLAWYNPINWTDYNGWVTIKLDKVYEIQKIVVRWRDKSGSGDSYGKKYKVLVSAMSDPGDPNLDNGYWEKVADVSNGDGGVDTYDLAAKKPLTRHVALWLQQDGQDWTSEWRGEEEFAIAEIEAWDAPKSSGPPPVAPGVCQ